MTDWDLLLTDAERELLRCVEQHEQQGHDQAHVRKREGSGHKDVDGRLGLRVRLARLRVGLTGLTVAEHFRDSEGQDVLLTGILPERRATGSGKKRPMGLKIEPGTCYVGHAIDPSDMACEP